MIVVDDMESLCKIDKSQLGRVLFNSVQSASPRVNVSEYPKFKNDRGVPEIQIGAKEFECTGVSAPHDHPHIYLNMGEADTIICPYCATLYRYTAGLGSGAIPADSVVETDS